MQTFRRCWKLKNILASSSKREVQIYTRNRFYLFPVNHVPLAMLNGSCTTRYMYSVNKVILVVLWNKTMNKDYIEFRLGKGACYSSVGRDGQRQYIVLDPRCAEKHTLIHEVTSLNSKTIIFENVFRFYTPLVCYTNISDQTEMSTLTLIWQLWLEQI